MAEREPNGRTNGMKLFDFSKKGMVRLLLVAAVAILICKFIFVPYHVNGYSMDPTCPDGSIVIVSTLSFYISVPRRGNLVVARTNKKPYLHILKRIVGMPGETISIRNGQVLINGKILDEPYVNRGKAIWNMKERQLDSDTYYLIGDNRTMPLKNHLHREVSKRNILGKAIPVYLAGP